MSGRQDQESALDLPPPGVSIEVQARLECDSEVVWGHLRFDRNGLRFRPQGAGAHVRVPMERVEDVQLASDGSLLIVVARGRTWRWLGEGSRRIYDSLVTARSIEAA